MREEIDLLFQKLYTIELIQPYQEDQLPEAVATQLQDHFYYCKKNNAKEGQTQSRQPLSAQITVVPHPCVFMFTVCINKDALETK